MLAPEKAGFKSGPLASHCLPKPQRFTDLWLPRFEIVQPLV
jgi:hypothetical protein